MFYGERMKQTLLLVFILLLSGADIVSTAQKRKRKQSVSSATQARTAEYFFTEGEKYYILEDYAKALVAFQKSLEIDPGNSAAYYKKAQIEFKNEELEKALADAEKATKLDPGNKYYYLLVIEILSQQGRFDEAVTVYETMLADVPGTDQFLYEVAAIHLFQENYDQALEIFGRVEDKFGLSEEIVLQRHKIFNQQGQIEKALKELNYLVDHFPLNDNYPLMLAEYYLNKGDDQSSIEILEAMMEQFPQHPRASLLLGEIYRKEKQYKKALPYLQRAFENQELTVDLKVQLISQYKILPRNEDLQNMISGLCKSLTEVHSEEANAFAIYGDFLLESEQRDLAIKQYQRSLEIDDSNFGVWQNLVLLYSKMNKFDDVILSADKAMVIFPNQSILYYLSGFAHIRKEMYEESVYLLKSGKRLAGENELLVADFNGLLGQAYHGLRDFQKSDSFFEKVLESQPDNFLVLNNYAYYLAEREEHLDKAEKMSARLVKENPGNVNYLDTHAWVLYARKKYREARKIAEKAVDSGKAKAVHYEHYGDILFQLGDVDGAVIQWEKAKGMDSSLKFIDKKIADRKLYEK